MKRVLKNRNFAVGVLILIAVCFSLVFAGDVVVQQGALTTDGDAAIGGDLSVAAGATVGGNLSVSGTLTSTGTASFGNGINLTKAGDNVIQATEYNRNIVFKVNSGGVTRIPLSFQAGDFGRPAFNYYAPPFTSGGIYIGGSYNPVRHRSCSLGIWGI